MPFHRFEDFKVHHLNPHLSSSEGPVIEGEYMYFRLVTKRAGTGSALHYHPNELMTFPLSGKINAVVGNERKQLGPGSVIQIPKGASYQWTATKPTRMAGVRSTAKVEAYIDQHGAADNWRG